MKTKRTIIAMLILVMAGINANATKWRVNNTGLQADFTTAQQVVNSSQVLSGDTVYFEPSTWSYGNMGLISKKLIIIGPGYFLGENDSTQANKTSARLGSVNFNAGSEGSVIKGMYLEGGMDIGSTSNILVERNYIESLQINYSSFKITVIRNYVKSIGASSCNHILIANNIIAYGGYWALSIGGNGSALVTNNVIAGYSSVNNCVFNNNICLSTNPGSFQRVNTSFENNLGAGTQFGTANGNQSNVDMNSVFTMTGSSDGQYTLKAGSPAIGAGVGGTDCGIFGGNYPYVLSGMVTGPSVYYLNMSGTDVTVKAKSH